MENKNIIDCKIENIDSIYIIDKSSSLYNWTRNMFINELLKENSFFKLITINNKIIGYIIYNVIFDEAEILNIVIDNKFKKQKYGSFILENTINHLRNLNIKNIFLEVGQTNIAAINLYINFGFIQYNIRNNYYKNKENALLMKKVL